MSHIAYRATAVENALRGKSAGTIKDAALQAAQDAEVLGDTYPSAEYRQHLVTVMTRRTLQEAAK